MKNIEKLIADLRSSPAAQAGEYAGKIIDRLSLAMAQDKELIMPVSLSEDIVSRFGTAHLTGSQLRECPDDFSFSIHTLPIQSGESVYVAFTNYDEVSKGGDVSTITTKIDHYLEAVLFNPDIAGLFINPFGNSCFLPKEFITEIFEQDYKNTKTDSSEFSPQVSLNDSAAVEEAVSFATECHKGDFRKGTDIPYITHPMEVAQILREVNADNSLIIAGLLHDVVEDAGISIDTIKEKYGDDVGSLVAAHSEDKSKVWYARKLKTIRDLPAEDMRSRLLTLADKLSNIRSMHRDYRLVGDELWNRFNAPKSMQSWYYSGIVDGLAQLQSVPAAAPAYWELAGIYNDLFVKYYIDSDSLYQISAHGENYVLHRGNPQWQKHSGAAPSAAAVVTRETAEKTEENWGQPFWTQHRLDMQDGEYGLYSSESSSFSVVIKDNKLTFSGQEYGPQCRQLNGKDEYEFFCVLDEDNTHRLLTQLRIADKSDRPLKDMLKAYFGTASGGARFMQLCEAVDVEYKFYGI